MKIFPTGSPAQISDHVHFIGQIEILLASAFNLPIAAEDRIIGAPEWVQQESNHYQLEAKIDDTLFASMHTMTSAQQGEQIALMEQALLADRLKLRYHLETRDLPMYQIVLAKGGPKLTPAKAGEANRLSTVSSVHGTELTAVAVTLNQLARSPFLLGRQLVTDGTGLQGAFDFTLRWTPDQPAHAADGNAEPDLSNDYPTLFTAIQQQLGLRIVSTSGPVEVLVIAHIEPPSPN